MSQYERSERVAGTIRGGLPDIPRQRIDVLVAPGVVPTPYAPDQNWNDLLRLGVAVGAFGRSLGDVAQSVRIERERAQRAEAQRQAEINAALEGQGKLQQDAELPGILTNILNGSETRTLDEIIAGQTDGLPTPAAEKYRELATGRISGAIAQRAENVRRQNVAANVDLITASAAGLTSPADLAAKVTSLRAVNPDLTERMAQDLVAGSALNYQAKYGDQAGLDSITQFLPKDYDAFRLAQVQNVLDVRMTREQTARDEAARQTGYNAINRAIDGEVSFDTAQQFINDLPVDPGVKLTLRNHLDTERRQSISKMDDAAFMAEQDRVGSAVAASLSGGIMPPDKLEVKLPSGATKTIDIKGDIIPMVVEQQFQQIDAAIPIDPLNPAIGQAARFSQKADYLSRLGGGVTYAPWESALNGAGYLAGKSDITPETVPPKLAEGVEIYRNLQATGKHALLNKMLKDPSSTILLSAVDTYMDLNKAPMNQAISDIVRQGGDRVARGLGNKKVDEAAMTDAVANLGGNNGLEVEDYLNRHVQLMRVLTGSADDAALVESAVKSFQATHTNVDGVWSYTQGLPVPPDIQDISNFAKGMIGNKDIAMTLNPETGVAGFKYVGGENDGEFVENAPIFSMEELNMASNYRRGLESAAILESNAKNDAHRRRFLMMMAGPIGRDSLTGVDGREPDLPKGLSPDVQATVDSTTKAADAIPAGVSANARKLMEYIRESRKPKPITPTSMSTLSQISDQLEQERMR